MLTDRTVRASVDWKALFSPDSVAVIGASDAPGSWGYNITWRLLNVGERPVYPVNPRVPEVQGVPAYGSVLDIPGPVALAVIAVPAELVARVLDECGQKGIRSAVVISGGFAEVGSEGARLQDDIARIARERGIRFVGPNTMGVFNNPARFSIVPWTGQTEAGRVALLSQSGNCGSRILHHGKAAGIGFSKFVCTGNEASLHLEDYLECVADDEDTSIITCYIEGLREGRRFYELAREITLRKPVVAMKSGGTEQSARAACSHTAAITGSEAVYRAAFRQAGVIQVDSDDELLDTVIALQDQPLPRGNRIGIVTIGGGLGVVATEACERVGLEMAQLSPRTMEKINGILPARWSHGNPVDLVGAVAGNPNIMSCLLAVLEDDNVDAVILQAPVLYGPSFAVYIFHFTPEQVKAFDERQKKSAAVFREEVKKHGKPVFIVTPVNDPETTALTLSEGIPIYPSPLRAAQVLGRLAWYRRYLDARRK